MDFILSTSYNQCNNEQDFKNLIINYPELKKYNARYSREDKKTLITIQDSDILVFIKNIEEDILISLENEKIIITDNAL